MATEIALLRAPLLPLAIVAATIVITMIALSIRRSHRFTFSLAGAGILAAIAASLSSRFPGAQQGVLFTADSFGLFYSVLLLSAYFVIVAVSFDYLRMRPESKEEYYLLFLGATLGALIIVVARHFVSFFLGLEILSVSLYPLIAYQRTSPSYTEAGLKYLVLSVVSSAFLLFGMALIYGATGTMDLAFVGTLPAGLNEEWLMTGAGTMLLVVGIGFKLGVVPFHMWTPDVYEGAPAPVTAFIATVSKGSIFCLLLRFFADVSLSDHPQLFYVFAIVAVLSMFAGNLLALFQNNVKRVLAYSSIAHFGYLMVAFLSSGPARVIAVTFYLTAYFVTTIGAFVVVTLLSGKEKDAGGMEEYEGLSERRPWLAAAFTFMLLSLAGMPLTVGFIGKIYIMAAGLGSLLWVLVAVLIINSAISLFYYLRIVVALFGPAVTGGAGRPAFALKGSVLLMGLFLVLVWWGVYPIPLIRLIEHIGIGR
jgi:NADH-quinone oxidoreductase subunit N